MWSGHILASPPRHSYMLEGTLRHVEGTGSTRFCVSFVVSFCWFWLVFAHVCLNETYWSAHSVGLVEPFEYAVLQLHSLLCNANGNGTTKKIEKEVKLYLTLPLVPQQTPCYLICELRSADSRWCLLRRLHQLWSGARLNLLPCATSTTPNLKTPGL